MQPPHTTPARTHSLNRLKTLELNQEYSALRVLTATSNNLSKLSLHCPRLTHLSVAKNNVSRLSGLALSSRALFHTAITISGYFCSKFVCFDSVKFLRPSTQLTTVPNLEHCTGLLEIDFSSNNMKGSFQTFAHVRGCKITIVDQPTHQRKK